MSEDQIIIQLNPDVPPTGSDLGIVNAARKSFGRRSEWGEATEDTYVLDGCLGWVMVGVNKGKTLKDKDKRLLEFLARGMTADDFDKLISDTAFWDLESESRVTSKLWEWRNTPTHDTPFNHGFFSFEVKAPIFVARQLVKHEYLIMSEYSRRYIIDDIEFYTPDVWRKAAADVKQGSSDEGVTLHPMTFVVDPLDDHQELNEATLEIYHFLLTQGVAPEQARMVLPQSLMTSWTWSGTLGAFANMCKLRLGKDTQYETRIVAQGVYEELKKQFPVAAPLLVEGVL